MKLLALVFSVLFLASCDNGQGFSFKEKLEQTQDVKTFMMTIELVDADKINKFCSDLGVQYESNGCAAFNLDTNHCTVYVAPQRFANDSERLEILGHEAWHCRFGKWHQ